MRPHAPFAAIVGLAGACVIAVPDNAGSQFRCDESPVCPDGFSCVDGVCARPGDAPSGSDGGAPVSTPRYASCAAAHAADPRAPSGTYVLDPGDGGGEFDATCDMTSNGGGWTLVMKIDGASDELAYDSPRWASGEVLEPTAIAPDRTQAVLDGFARLPADEVAIQLATAGGPGPDGVTLAVGASSLRATFAEPNRTALGGVGRDAWLAALPGATLQDHCNLEGINLDYGYNRLRLGIVANNEDDCASPDSRIGIGAGSNCPTCGCQGFVTPTAGGNDNGCTLTPAFAWVWVR